MTDFLILARGFVVLGLSIATGLGLGLLVVWAIAP